MKIFQSRSFQRKVNKFSKAQKSQLDKQIKRILEDPAIGTEKKGDLRGIYVHKFKLRTIQYLLAYRIAGENLELIMIGPHQNYYRDLKKYIKST
jgi:mRNA-degrading endonuclease RelE of RelBE toxin-antitoxin system